MLSAQVGDAIKKTRLCKRSKKQGGRTEKVENKERRVPYLRNSLQLYSHYPARRANSGSNFSSPRQDVNSSPQQLSIVRTAGRTPAVVAPSPCPGTATISYHKHEPQRNTHTILITSLSPQPDSRRPKCRTRFPFPISISSRYQKNKSLKAMAT